jgi:predicted TIM-barrel fold metal-dependent hydrolase
MFRFPMSGDAVREILKLANEHAMVVFVHCGVLKVGFRTKLGLPCAFVPTLATPLHLQPLCAEFSRAKFVIPHLGSGLFRELLMLGDQCPNVYTDTSGAAGWAKYLDGEPTRAQVLRQAVDVMGADRLLFGTDSTFFPRGWRRDVFDEQLRIFADAQLTAEQVEMILGRNLDRLIGLASAVQTP